LTRDINKRLGVGEKGFRRLMSHSWLQHIQWELVETKQLDPPFIPDVSILFNLSHGCTDFFFDFYY
jgi:hypothetical protein